MNFLFSPIQEMGRGCCFGIGCLIGLVAVLALALLFLGIINTDWLTDLLEGFIG